jgi:hypothetical protein
MELDEIRGAGKATKKAYADTLTEAQGPHNDEVRQLQVSSQETPMGHVWFIVLLSMCVTFAGAWIWHIGGMNDQARRNKAVDAVVITNTEQIAHYRDIFKEKGKEAAIASLSSSPNIYGN